MGPIIDITALFPYRAIILFAYSFAFFNISNSVCKSKINSFVTFLCILAARIITSALFFDRGNLDVLGYPAFFILFFVILFFLTDGKTIKKITCLIFSLLSQFVSSIIIGQFSIIIFQGKDRTEIFGDNYNLYFLYEFLTECIIIISVSFLFAGILKLTGKSESKNKKINAYISFVPFSHIFITIFCIFLAPTDSSSTINYSPTTTMIIYIMMAAIMLFDCSFPFVIDHFEKLELMNDENQKYIMKNKLDYYQVQLQKQENDSFRKIKHDYINITNTAKGLIEIGKPEKAVKILSQINEDMLNVSGFSLSMNETVNIILYAKSQQASTKGIKLDISIDESSPILINDYDLCRILSNLIDNALNAVLLSNNGKLCKIRITASDEELIIETKNNFDAKQNKIKKSKLHGNGIGIIKEIISKYDGKYSASQQDDVWYTQTRVNNIKLADSITPPPILS